MSKDDFPPSITSEMILENVFEFIEDWKGRLFDMMSYNTKTMGQVVISNWQQTDKIYEIIQNPEREPAIKIKQEPPDKVSIIQVNFC